MIRPGNAPINSPIFDNAPTRLRELWTQWFTNLAALFSKTGQVTSVTVSGSPFTYQNPNTYLEQALIHGGTVTSVLYSRDGVAFFQVASSTNVSVLLSGSDFLRITWTVAPSLNIAPL